MNTSRRDFLTTMILAPGVLALAGESALAFGGVRDQRVPVVTNYNATGKSILEEGHTLLVGLTFAGLVDPGKARGSFPVMIEPESFGGQQLEEPQPLYFYPSADRKTLYTILTAPLDPAAGPGFPLQFSITGKSEERLTWNYAIRTFPYRNTVLTLDKEFSEPAPETSAQIKRDFAEMVEVLKSRTDRKWTQPFMLPVTGGDNDNFGVKRTVNKTKRYRHRGLDMHARMGTPVKAINDGRVALSTEQWVAGQTVVIDHGGGVFSKYAHLSARKVNKGDQVLRGQVIALSGNSGGQKAPAHLHLDTIVNGSHCDPKDFMRTAQKLIDVENGVKVR